MHVGGRPEKSPMTTRDLEICAAIGPTLRDQGMIFVGIDVIGDYLTEINVTSPTGLQENRTVRWRPHREVNLGPDRGEGARPLSRITCVPERQL